jgi:CRISPR/Cas system-associated exonuclease Cas4 (RecB family)
VQVESLVRSGADEDDLAYLARGVLRAVEAGVDHPIRGWQCKGCPYMAVCS